MTTTEKPGFITVIDENSARNNAYLHIPWDAYENGVPINNLNRYNEAIEEIVSINNSLKKSVIAFASDKCPDGFYPYKKAQGRFIRGLDKSGKIDPDGKRRSIGSFQDDSLKKHRHSHDSIGWGAGASNLGKGRADGNSPKHDWNIYSSYTGGEETRPKNVALLYCIRK